MIATATAFLVIMACNGDERDMACPEEIRPETWVSVKGSDPKEECERFIHSKTFEPTDYITGYDFYAVRCER